MVFEPCSCFSGGFTLILKSTGPASRHQPRCLGVYRMVDHHDGRPAYRQDEGDHFLYYNAQYSAWMVGKDHLLNTPFVGIMINCFPQVLGSVTTTPGLRIAIRAACLSRLLLGAVLALP